MFQFSFLSFIDKEKFQIIHFSMFYYLILDLFFHNFLILKINKFVNKL